jgi:putative DNA primase/helicase
MMIQESIARRKALAFAKRGYKVLPLHGIYNDRCTCGDVQCCSAGKHPRTRHGAKDATTDPEIISEWFDEHPDSNYGVCTDTLPTLDIDPRNSGDKAWQKLVKENWLPHTWEVKTGGGGTHLIFGSTSTPVPCGKLTRGVDVKGVGGYIVGVGSLHRSGRRYRWHEHAQPKNTELMAVPAWVLDALARTKPSHADAPRDQDYYNKFLEPALPGERHQHVAALIGHLFGSAFPNRGVLLGLVISHVKLTYPDLEDFGVDEIVEIARGLAKCERRKREAA